MKLHIDPVPAGYLADKAVILTDSDGDAHILLACDNAKALGEAICYAVNNVGYFEDTELKAEAYEEALHKIVRWSEAYPVDIFPEPDLVKARQLLAAGGITLDSIAAHCMRHVIEGVGKIAKKALGK